MHRAIVGANDLTDYAITVFLRGKLRSVPLASPDTQPRYLVIIGRCSVSNTDAIVGLIVLLRLARVRDKPPKCLVLRHTVIDGAFGGHVRIFADIEDAFPGSEAADEFICHFGIVEACLHLAVTRRGFSPRIVGVHVAIEVFLLVVGIAFDDGAALVTLTIWGWGVLTFGIGHLGGLLLG